MENNQELYGYILTNAELPVDVFHYTAKHKQDHDYCRTYCNPHNFKELISEGEWVFNSSAAEQVNVWFGGFQALVREMGVDMYNFTLDQVIMVRNRFTVSELERKGRKPHIAPLDFLLKHVR